MQNQGKGQKKLRGIFPADSKGRKAEDKNRKPPAVFSSTGQFYAVASEDETVKRFKLILRSGKTYSVPYSLLPICIQPDSSILFIKAYELLITILGRNLDPIEEHFSDELLLWIKVSPSGRDDGQAGTFIEDILVQGKAVSVSEDN